MVVAIVRVAVLSLARLVVGVLRDLTEALGELLHALGRVMVGLVGLVALAVIANAAFLPMVVHVAVPPVVWPGLAGAALGATLTWLLGRCLVCVARPGRLARRLTDPGRRGVSDRRIAEWEAAWRRALLYQERLRHQAAGGERRASSGPRGRGWWRGRPAESPYEVLGIEPGATPDEIRAAYRRLAMRLHPDRNPGFAGEATRRFRQIQAAYELLSDPTWRAQPGR